MTDFDLHPLATEALRKSLFRNHPEDPAIDGLIRAGEGVCFETGSLLLEEGKPADSVFVLLTGAVKVLFTSPDGFEVVVKIFRPPAVFGEMEVLTDVPYLEAVQALEKSKALVVPAAAFTDHLATSPALSAGLVKDLAARLCIAAQNERSLAFDSVERRLANMLCTYLDLFGLPTVDGPRIRIPLSQEELARSLGVARRSVTRVLQAWADDSILTKAGKHYVVRDVEALVGKSSEGLCIGYSSAHPLRRRAG